MLGHPVSGLINLDPYQSLLPCIAIHIDREVTRSVVG